MHEAIAQEFAQPAKLRLGAQQYLLAFPMRAVILYRQETAKLDRARAAQRPPLERGALQVLRRRRRAAIDEARALVPADGKMDAAAESHFNDLLEEANRLKVAIDEETAAGDSLMDRSTWWKIGPLDPERLRLAVWAGTHVKSPEGKFVESLSLEQLDDLIDIGNAEAVTADIAEALRRYIPQRTPDLTPVPAPTGVSPNPPTAESPAK